MNTIAIHEEPTWVTGTGKRIPLSEIDHQHLSNILWYYKLLVGCEPHKRIMQLYREKFACIQLSFKPLPIPHELYDLHKKGYLKDDGRIVYNNGIIGDVLHIPNWKELIEIY